MAVSIVKGKTKTAGKQSQELQLEEKVDLLGETAERVDQLNKKIKAIQADPAFTRLKELKAELQEVANETVGGLEELHLSGEFYAVDIGACSKKRSIIDPVVVSDELETVEEDLSYKLAKYNLTDLDKYLTPLQLAKCVEEAFTGNRHVKVVKIADD